MLCGLMDWHFTVYTIQHDQDKVYHLMGPSWALMGPPGPPMRCSRAPLGCSRARLDPGPHTKFVVLTPSHRPCMQNKHNLLTTHWPLHSGYTRSVVISLWNVLQKNNYNPSISRMERPVGTDTPFFFYKHQVYKHTQPQIIVFISKSLSTLPASDSVSTVFSLGFHVPAPPRLSPRYEIFENIWNYFKIWLFEKYLKNIWKIFQMFFSFDSGEFIWFIWFRWVKTSKALKQNEIKKTLPVINIFKLLSTLLSMFQPENWHFSKARWGWEKKRACL
jgi:hypothetical protein